MRLYVKNSRGDKVHLDVSATSKRDLASKIGVQFQVQGEHYHINQVIAESSNNDTAGGAVVGGILGLIVGGAGMVVGGILGGLLGSSSDTKEQKNVQNFNSTKL